jgi:hypothetical protein
LGRSTFYRLIINLAQLLEYLNFHLNAVDPSLRVNSLDDPLFGDGRAWLALLQALFGVEPRKYVLSLACVCA